MQTTSCCGACQHNSSSVHSYPTSTLTKYIHNNINAPCTRNCTHTFHAPTKASKSERGQQQRQDLVLDIKSNERTCIYASLRRETLTASVANKYVHGVSSYCVCHPCPNTAIDSLYPFVCALCLTSASIFEHVQTSESNHPEYSSKPISHHNSSRC